MAERKFYRLTNDLMFHIVMQESEVALRGLVASLLSKRPEEIKDVVVLNPIDYGQQIDGKEIILDVGARVNDDVLVNVEVQVRRYETWHLRSLYYAARMAAQSNPGKTYSELPFIRQFSILDYPFDKEEPEFFSEYELRNKKTGKSYTDRFRISIMDLTKINLSTEEDNLSGRRIWAELFRAKSWEELDKLAQENELAKEVVKIMSMSVKEAKLAYSMAQRDIAKMDALSREKEAEQYGMEKGMEIKACQVAKKLLEKDMSYNLIREVTGYSFSDSELERLR
ncbi:Rpn family recombination-promoting nuclease/putative transposase [Peptococcus niger]|uniref:PD-(D/E)XK nuclease family transposase n=1 Tax=Peptococcus niger TaxID=2741 RepID=A0A1G6Z5V6_PEPNI|nr:Rpn family recombination-promoting nuclease/putative transposase [Peptococcus niger]SDD98008.1 conserved hypothetical protein (putative transposase or invertase) [Peptococcus niger]